MAPRLVATDADGTLLDDANMVSVRTAAVVRRVVAAGVPFVLASGRPARTLGKIAARAGVAGLAVCSNGAVVYDMRRERALRVVTLTPGSLRAVVTAFDTDLPGCAYAVESMEGRPALLAEHGFRAVRSIKCEAASREEMLARAGVKIVVSHPGMTSAALAATAAAMFGDTVSVTFSQAGGLIELAAAGVDKGSGLAWAADHLGIAAGETVAFGDMPNDIPMLVRVDHGVAVANAHPDVIAVAAEVTAANRDDGVARVLERWF
ncbi:HAD family hydrolase [Catellatospora sichuanensis]|uniref:HAD family hydrolase n=1 Tax=Catellatospora sichuanensis TaxID=1969805 RepID=UPI001C919A83|nr:HAD family hydrolase [Catellatospora sichuanensis]